MAGKAGPPGRDVRSASGGSGGSGESGSLLAELPWGAVKLITPSLVDPGVQPGEFAAQTLFVDFVMTAERKIQQVLQEPLEKPLTNTLKRGEDPHFDQILSTLHGVAEHCLPSLLRALFCWYDEQNRQLFTWLQQKSQQQQAATPKNETRQAPKCEPKSEIRDYVLEKRGLAVDFIFCLVLVEIMKQLYLHPGYDEQINHIIQLAFKQFKFKDPVQLGVVSGNTHIIADLFAEVIGVLTLSRFHMVRKKFLAELNDLKQKETAPLVPQHIISLLMGMKFFRVKMGPIEEFEMCMGFLHELGIYFLEVKDKDIKHALAGLFVEILLPVAANVKTEVNVPALKNFVELLYSHSLDMANKKKHSLAAFPLLTCLLCISQKQFFLTNWHYFLTLCLSNLRSKDQKMSRVALESLFRLLWVYVIRIKCESNRATDSRLQSICTSLFPRGGRTVIPRDTPLNIFVKIIHFIAQERVDFAFKEIIFDLLSVGRPIRNIYPERMNIGLRALMVIADSLQQRDGPPPMPRSIGILPSGSTLRVKKTYLTRPLTADVARTIGLELYYAPCRRAFDGILRALDLQVGRPLMMNVLQSSGKDPDDLLGGERKPKLDLFRTCLAAIPRLLPDGMSHQDLIDLLARMTLHMDEELRGLACQTLQNLVSECRDWREDVIHGFLQFISRDIQDGCPQLLDNALRLLLQLLCSWKAAAYMMAKRGRPVSEVGLRPANANRVQVSPLLKADGTSLALHCVEGLALVMLCQGRGTPRKLAVTLLKEVKHLLPLLCGEDHERAVIDVLDSAVPHVLGKYVQQASVSEKGTWPPPSQIDFQWMADKIPSLEMDYKQVSVEQGNEYFQWDSWASALSGFTESGFLLNQCPTATAYAWPTAYMRITACFAYVDPNNPQNDTRASLLRSSKSKATSGLCGETLNYNHYLSLWQKYLVLTCAVAPPAANSATLVQHGSNMNLHSSDGEGLSKPMELRIPRVANVSASNLFKLVVPLLRCEMTDMRDIVVLGLGSVNPASFECLLDELGPMLREATEKKQESVRRRRRRDLLRLQLIRMMEVVAFRDTLPLAGMTDGMGCLKSVIADFLDSARGFLESDQDRDAQTFSSMKLHFAKMTHILISSFPVEKRMNLLGPEKRQQLFILFTSWSNRIGLVFDRRYMKDKDNLSPAEHHAVSAMCSVLCCGPVFESVKSISDESGYLYGWLDALLNSPNEKVAAMSEETLVHLLDFNSEVAPLLDWVVDKCYTSPGKVADKCFRALATVFGQREYPCDMVSMFNVTLMYAGYPVTEMQQMAVELLQILDQRFFGDSENQLHLGSGSASTIGEEDENEDGDGWNGGNNSGSDGKGEGGIQGGTGDMLNPSFAKSQISLSTQLAELHPDCTVAMFSEVSQKINTAKPARQASMLRYLLPWLYNVELVDQNLEPSSRTVTLSLSAKISESQALARRILKGEGWGSALATELVLNNMFFLTVKFGNEHSFLIEKLWAGLVAYWPSNLRVILRYLEVISTLSPENMLPYAKRVIVYLARVNSERLVEELINELQTIDVFRMPLERSEMAPYFRWIRKPDNAETGTVRAEQRDGLIHTRRHTPSEAEPSGPSSLIDDDLHSDREDEEGFGELGDNETLEELSASMASLVTLKAEILNAKVSTPVGSGEERHREYVQPYHLPMPAYGGYFCRLDLYLPQNESIMLIPRSNLALLLMSDLVIADVDIEWTVHLPLILHMAVLGLDHSRFLINDHCKQLLLNLIVFHSAGRVPAKDVAAVLLTHSLGSQLSLASTRMNSDSNGMERFDTVNSRASTAVVTDDRPGSTDSRSETPTPLPVLRNKNRQQPDSSSRILEKDTISTHFESLSVLIVEMTDFIASRLGRTVWSNEDITAKCWRIVSGQQLACFVSHLSHLFSQLVPQARIETRWAQTALHIALSCSNRHYAGRSFQIFRALRMAPTSRMISDILSRLVETVGEQGDDMQGYVTEIMLTLDASVLNMEVAEHSLIGLFKAEPEPDLPANQPANRHSSPTHCRSTSYSVAMIKRLSPAAERRDQRSSMVEQDSHAQGVLPRSKSAQALKSVPEGQEEHIASLAQLMWISTSLLESDLEHEFSLGLHLLEKLLDLPEFERQDCLDRLDRMVKQLQWNTYPGLLSLVLKGCTFGNTYETTVLLLTKLIVVLDWAVVDLTESGLAFILTAVLPYLVMHYEEPTKLCILTAENIAEYLVHKMEQMRQTERGEEEKGAQEVQRGPEHPLEHLITVLRLYSKRNFTRDCFQWTKCVVKYMHDGFSPTSSQLLILLAEMLERSNNMVHLPILQVIYCVFHHVEFAGASPAALNADLLKVVSKHIQGPNWREAARIIKLAVTRSSSFSVPGSGGPLDAEMGRRELPGRTMNFHVDVPMLTSLTFGGQSQFVGNLASSAEGSPKKQVSESSLRKIKEGMGQLRVREHLVNLLNASGLRVGLPKSPSVIFSQSSHDIGAELPSSVCSSSGEKGESGERSLTPSPDAIQSDYTSDSFPRVFKEFDFLEAEHDSVSESNESCFNWLSTMRPRSISNADDEGLSGEGRGTGSVSDLGRTLDNTRSDSDSSDEEESASSQAEEEGAGNTSVEENERRFTVSIPERDERPQTPASESRMSLVESVGTPSVEWSFSQFPLFGLECSHHGTGQVEETWTLTVSEISSDQEGISTANATLIFAQLYRESCTKACGLLRDACHFLQMSKGFRDVSNHFLDALEVLMRIGDCPFMFLTASLLKSDKAIQRQKFDIFELREHFETFQERREYCIRVLNGVKSSLKLQLMGQKVEEQATVDQGVDLCRSLHKLFFQLLLMLEGFHKMVQQFTSKPDPEVNLSAELLVMHRELLCAVNEMSGASDPPASVEVVPNPLGHLVQLLQSREYKLAISHLRAFRNSQNKLELYGCCEEVDVEVLLLLYCKAAAENRPVIMAVIGSEASLAESSNQLRETNLSLSSVVRALSTSVRTPRGMQPQSAPHLSAASKISITESL